jgi:protein-tyrosine kinase
VTDNTPDDAGKPRPDARTSLVERAAEKMRAAQLGRRKQDAESAADGGPLAAALQATPAPPKGAPDGDAFPPSATPPSATADPLRDGEALGPLAAADGSEAAEEAAAKGAPARRKLRSRVAKIDAASLAARGIMTPVTKRSRTVEEFRLIKRMVLSQRWEIRDAPGNTIVVTSALPAEGKTTTAINLAMSIAAEEDLRVLLVDADFIKPDALRQLGVKASKGLIDVLHDPRMDIADVMLRTDVEKLSLIPSGQLHDRCTELLASTRMDELIKELAGRYEDRILIFDSPPILATTESVALVSHMGQVVFVVQAGRTKRESVDSALELIGERPHLGLILNRAASGFGKTDFGSYYGSYHYSYGSKTSA